jgi:hypothetical protein
MTPHGHQERWSASWKLAMNSATGFLMNFYGLRPACQERKETVRFPGELAPQADQPSARFVSMIVRRTA